MKAASRRTWWPVFSCRRLPRSPNSSTGRPSSSTAARFGPFLWMQATTGRNPRGCLRTRATNWPSAPPMANWFTICRTGTGSFTPPPRPLESCVLRRPKGRSVSPGRLHLCLSAPAVTVDAGGEGAQRVQEPRERVPRELLADEVPDERREQGAGLVGHLAVARAPGRPERAGDEPQHPEETHDPELPEHLQLEVVRDVRVLDRIVDRRVLLPRGEERRLAHAEQRPLLEDARRDLPRLQAPLGAPCASTSSPRPGPRRGGPAIRRASASRRCPSAPQSRPRRRRSGATAPARARRSRARSAPPRPAPCSRGSDRP